MLPVDRRRGHDHLAVGLEGYRRFRRRSVHDSAHAVCAIRPIEASLPGVPAHDEIPGHVANRQEEAAVPLKRDPRTGRPSGNGRDNDTPHPESRVE